MNFNRFARRKAADGETKPKYKNSKIAIDGRKYDSKAEADRSIVLRFQVSRGYISELEYQPTFVLQESFIDNRGRRNAAIKYIADFMYIENGLTIVEDVKGMQTPDYKIKAKLFRAKYPELQHWEIKDGKDLHQPPPPKTPKVQKPKKPKKEQKP